MLLFYPFLIHFYLLFFSFSFRNLIALLFSWTFFFFNAGPLTCMPISLQSKITTCPPFSYFAHTFSVAPHAPEDGGFLGFFCFFCFDFLPFLRLLPGHVEVPRLGVKSELWPLIYTTATAMPAPSSICDLHHSSWQCQVLNPLSEARDWTLVGFINHWATTGTPITGYWIQFPFAWQ